VFLLTLRLHGIRLSRRILLALLIFPIYGVLDESTQPLVNRYASIMDWIANVVGILAAVFLDGVIALVQRFWKKH